VAASRIDGKIKAEDGFGLYISSDQFVVWVGGDTRGYEWNRR
jgi:hypothetical protein